MPNYEHDQAEGLRRMLAGPKPRIVTLLSVLPEAEKSATLINLGASLARAGSDVLVLDASLRADGVAGRLGDLPRATLMQAARGECTLEQAVRMLPQGFRLAALVATGNRPAHADELERLCGRLTQQSDIVLADAALGDDGSLPLAALAAGEMVVQVATDAASITAGYALIKRMNAAFGRRSFGVLVSGASEEQAQLVFRNMAQAANRYLALPLHAVGSVPADDHIGRAARLGRAVVDAFPLAGASVAFRRLAGRLALRELPLGNNGMLAGGANRGI
ncbi:MAG TPA: antiactivator of flagellar biosynthesis FleN protein [Burkholderiaceae bacterium]|nr:antiactivator of flagellar biosynthesis FleN protein [Burkholderiaceae bacterium]